MDDQSSVDSSAQLSAHTPVASSAASQPISFVTTQQFEAMNDKWTEQFAHFEALLSRGNVFTTPKTVVSSLPTTTSTLISSQPFINPAARHTGPVVSPAVQETLPKGGESKPIKKAHKSSKSDKAKLDFGPQATASSGPVLDIPSLEHELVFQQIHASCRETADMGFQSTGSEQTTSPEHKTTGSTSCSPKHPKAPVFLIQPLIHWLHLVFPLPVLAMVCRTETTGIYPSRIFLMLSSPEMRILL